MKWWWSGVCKGTGMWYESGECSGDKAVCSVYGSRVMGSVANSSFQLSLS